MNATTAKAIKEIVRLMSSDFTTPQGYGGLSWQGQQTMEALLIQLAEGIKSDVIQTGGSNAD